MKEITPLAMSLVLDEFCDRIKEAGHTQSVRMYGVPRGGVPVALYLAARCPEWLLVSDPASANVFVDDCVDSGATRERYRARFPGVPFYGVFERGVNWSGEWLCFPWESTEDDKSLGSIDAVFTRLLQYVGEDVQRQGLHETPARAARAWLDWTAGYRTNPQELLKVFEDGAENVKEMVLVRDIPFYSHCEHHMAPFFGTATVGYIPNGKIVGLSKIARLVDAYAKRLQVQERLTGQIADMMHTALGCVGVGVLVRARHLCMESRGVCKQGHETITSALRGAMFEEGTARAEFLALARR